MSKSILIVEDNGVTAIDLKDMLKAMGYGTIYVATNYTKAIQIYKSHKPDMILLDINLQEQKDGIGIARYIRKTDDIPIIYLTADTDEETIQRAALTKPSNYLNKPFTFEELKTAVTLAWYIYQNHTLSQSDLRQLTAQHSYDYTTGNLYEADRPIHLTPNEKVLIEIYCRHKKQILSPASLSNLIWMGDTPISDNSLRTLIYRLHKKLKHNLFEHISPAGYRIAAMLLSDGEKPS